MNIILTCGHKVDSLDRAYPVMTKAFDNRGEKAVSHRVVCGSCEDMYRQQGEFFETEDHAQEWLLKKGW
jgi:hypothetical protein